MLPAAPEQGENAAPIRASARVKRAPLARRNDSVAGALARTLR
jgi:hypothetical protein